MIGPYPSEVVRVVCVCLSPFVMVFGIYVTAHGHYGPGGGFAGGVMIAVGVLLLRLTLEESLSFRGFPEWIGVAAGSAGLLLMVLVGVVPVLAGGAFLDYAEVAVSGLPAPRLRYLGILVVEIAIGLAVAGTMLAIFDTIARGRRGTDG